MAAFVTAYGHNSPSIRMRSVVEAPGNNIQYDEYEINIKYDCWYDEIYISFNDDMGQLNYNFGDVTTGLAYQEMFGGTYAGPVVTHVNATLSDCPLSYKLFTYFSLKSLWYDISSCASCTDNTAACWSECINFCIKSFDSNTG